MLPKGHIYKWIIPVCHSEKIKEVRSKLKKIEPGIYAPSSFGVMGISFEYVGLSLEHKTNTIKQAKDLLMKEGLIK